MDYVCLPINMPTDLGFISPTKLLVTGCNRQQNAEQQGHFTSKQIVQKWHGRWQGSSASSPTSSSWTGRLNTVEMANRGRLQVHNQAAQVVAMKRSLIRVVSADLACTFSAPTCSLTCNTSFPSCEEGPAPILLAEWSGLEISAPCHGLHMCCCCRWFCVCDWLCSIHQSAQSHACEHEGASEMQSLWLHAAFNMLTGCQTQTY